MQIRSLTLENNLFLAPMAGVTDLPFRLIVKEFGAGLVFTEMVSASGLMFNGRKTRELLRSDSREKPLGVQLFGSDPDILARAAAEVEADADLIDLNMGCPVKKVVRSGSGAALMGEPDRAAGIIRGVRKATSRPLTVKFRSGWDKGNQNFLDFGRMAQEEGADAVTLHPRTRAQSFGGHADWTQIGLLKNALSIPVIGNGDIFSGSDARAIVQQTGCDAIMLARGCYGNPWLIREILAAQTGECSVAPSIAEKGAIACRHLALHLEIFGPRRTLGEMRKHLSWYSRSISDAASYRANVNSCRSVEEMADITEAFFANAAADHHGQIH